MRDLRGGCNDLSGDDLIGSEELLYLLAAFGGTVEDNPDISVIDINYDGIIDTEDLLNLLAQFGTYCSGCNIGVTTRIII